MKKLISYMVAFALVLSCVPMYGVNAATNSDEGLIDFMSDLNIMTGDPDGNFRLDDYVTRAEFTKVAIAASVHKNSVATRLTVSPYPDVTYTHWAAPYVSVAVTNGLVTGYEDSTFRPENNVSLEEAVTIVLKILGYTNDDFGASWPYGQMGLANNLDLTDNIDRVIGDALTRRDVAQLISNLMMTKSKGSNANYITTLDYDVIEDVTLIATTREDMAVGSDKIYTSGGTYKIDDSFDYSLVGRKGDLVIKNGSDFVSFVPDEQIIGEYNVYQVIDEKIIVSNGSTLENLNVDSTVTVYDKSTKTNLKSIMSTMAPGDMITTYRNSNGVIDYAMVKTGETEGPFVVKSQNWMSTYDVSGINVYFRDGAKATPTDIAVNDVIYYSKALGTLWAYNDRVTGIYESAQPNKDMPTSVVISGKSYNIEGADAYDALSSNGIYNYGDTVTVLLGRTGSIAGIADQSTVSSEIYGVLDSVGTKQYTGTNGNTYTSNYISVMLTDGSYQEYITSKDYSSYVNSVVLVTFKNGSANITPARKQTSMYGKVNASKNVIGKFKLADDVEIVDVVNSDLNTGKAVVTYLSRLDGLSLTASDILYFTKNAVGDIDRLFLNDVTGDAYSYGYITGSDTTKNYTFNSGENAYSLGGFSVKANTVVKAIVKGNSVVSYKGELVKVSKAIKSVDHTKLTTTSGTTYLLGNNVSVYYRNYNNALENIHLDDIVNGDYTLSAYYDKDPARGGRIRVIVAY